MSNGKGTSGTNNLLDKQIMRQFATIDSPWLVEMKEDYKVRDQVFQPR